MIDKARESAFNNIVLSLDLTRSFPSQVFREEGGWEFRFFESDRIFSPSFADIIFNIMFIEKTTSSCLLNISRTSVQSYREADTIFFETGMNVDYDTQLRHGGPASGWLFGMDHYGCASDSGDWILYCEKENDVAVAALRGLIATKMLSDPLRELHAEAIDDLIRHGSTATFPFNSLVPSWKTGLSKYYSSSQTA